MKEIWSNPNPQSSFSPTTINVPIDDVMLIEFCMNTTQNSVRCTFLLNADWANFGIPSKDNNEAGARAVEKREDGIYFGDGYHFSTSPYTRIENSYMIPNKIYTL